MDRHVKLNGRMRASGNAPGTCGGIPQPNGGIVAESSQEFALGRDAEMLNQRGVKPKRGEFWWHSSVLRILARTAVPAL